MECMNFREYKSGALLGFANLFIEKMGLEIYGCTLHEKEGRKWLNLPTREYEDENGDRKYLNVVRFREKSHYTTFMESAKECVEKWITTNSEGDDTESKDQIEPDPEGLPF